MTALLYIFKLEDYYKDVFKTVKENLRKNIIFVTSNKPAEILITHLKEEKINENRILFIDAVSKYMSINIIERDNIIYVDSPSNLTSLGILIRGAIENIKGEKVIIFDSLSTLSLYNEFKILSRFYNFVINLSRIKSINTIIFTMETESEKEVLKDIKGIVDGVKVYE